MEDVLTQTPKDARLGTLSEDFVPAQHTFAAVQVEETMEEETMVEAIMVEAIMVEATMVEAIMVEETTVGETMVEETTVEAMLVEATSAPILIPTPQADTHTEAAMPKCSTS